MEQDELDARQALITQCRAMNASGLNQSTSGNISVRFGAHMLITPSATPYDIMTPDMIAAMPLSGAYGAWNGPLKPSSEWRFHLDILRRRADARAIWLATELETLAWQYWLALQIGGPVLLSDREIAEVGAKFGVSGYGIAARKPAPKVRSTKTAAKDGRAGNGRDGSGARKS